MLFKFKDLVAKQHQNYTHAYIHTYWDHLWQCVRREYAHTTIPTLTLHPSLITREAATLCVSILSLWSVSTHHSLVLSTTSDLGSSEVLRAEEWKRGNLEEELGRRRERRNGGRSGERKEVREGKGRGEKREKGEKGIFSLLNLLLPPPFLPPLFPPPSVPAKIAITDPRYSFKVDAKDQDMHYSHLA